MGGRATVKGSIQKRTTKKGDVSYLVRVELPTGSTSPRQLSARGYARWRKSSDVSSLSATAMARS